MLSTGAAATSTLWRSLTSNFIRTREVHFFATVMNSSRFAIHAAEIFIDQGAMAPLAPMKLHHCLHRRAAVTPGPLL